jgi:hypothetical protein
MHDFDKMGYLGGGIRQFQQSTFTSFNQFFTLSRDVCRFARAKVLQLKWDKTEAKRFFPVQLDEDLDGEFKDDDTWTMLIEQFYMYVREHGPRISARLRNGWSCREL